MVSEKMKTMAKKNQAPQWGPDAPPKVLHPGFGEETDPATLQYGLEKYTVEAVMCGFTIVYREPYNVVLERYHAPGSMGRNAALGFLFFGVVGAAVGAVGTADARVERIQMWVDSHGAIYVK